VPVGCRSWPSCTPLVGCGWLAASGCCAVAAYHRDAVPPINGALRAAQQFAIDFTQLGPNDACCHGPFQALTSWWGYDTPVLAVAPGVVVEVCELDARKQREHG
jgi:hypothetical protein